jgi:hypothetical protein
MIAACFVIGSTAAALSQQNRTVKPLSAASPTINVCEVFFSSYPPPIPLKTFNPAAADALSAPNGKIYVMDAILAADCGGDILIGAEFTRSFVMNSAGQWIYKKLDILMETNDIFAFAVRDYDYVETDKKDFELKVANSGSAVSAGGR